MTSWISNFSIFDVDTLSMKNLKLQIPWPERLVCPLFACHVGCSHHLLRGYPERRWGVLCLVVPKDFEPKESELKWLGSEVESFFPLCGCV